MGGIIMIIGICGKSGSGKSTIAKMIIDKYKDRVIHLDIDKKAMDVSFCREGDSVAIVANIPVMKEPRRAV